MMETAEDQLKKLEEVLDEYDISLGIKFGKNDKVEQYLSFTHEQLERLDEEQCGIMSYELALYSATLQKEYNRQNAKANWCEARIKDHISKRLQQYKTGYQNYEELKMLAINGDEYTRKLFQLKTQAETRVNETDSLSYKIDLIVKSLDRLQNAKRKNR